MRCRYVKQQAFTMLSCFQAADQAAKRLAKNREKTVKEATQDMDEAVE